MLAPAQHQQRLQSVINQGRKAHLKLNTNITEKKNIWLHEVKNKMSSYSKCCVPFAAVHNDNTTCAQFMADGSMDCLPCVMHFIAMQLRHQCVPLFNLWVKVRSGVEDALRFLPLTCISACIHACMTRTVNIHISPTHIHHIHAQASSSQGRKAHMTAQTYDIACCSQSRAEGSLDDAKTDAWL